MKHFLLLATFLFLTSCANMHPSNGFFASQQASDASAQAGMNAANAAANASMPMGSFP